MKRCRALLLLLAVMAPEVGASQPTCVKSPMSDQQIKEIMDKEKAARTDLPTPFPQYRWVVRREGCHYVYIEYGIPEVPEYSRIFKLNQYGVLVDVQPSGRGQSMKCPEKVFTERELAEIIRKERETRRDLPPAFPQQRIRVDRLRCLYLYFEYRLPERRGDYQVFTVDPLGELMDFSRSEPY